MEITDKHIEKIKELEDLQRATDQIEKICAENRTAENEKKWLDAREKERRCLKEYIFSVIEGAL